MITQSTSSIINNNTDTITNTNNIDTDNAITSASSSINSSFSHNQSLEQCELNSEPCIRRSSRAIGSSDLYRRDVIKLLEKIKTNHEDTVVLKLKMHISSQISYPVMDAILDALYDNNVCQALYIQNYTIAFAEPQMKKLVDLLKKKKNIWCINMGELYDMSLAIWEYFTESLVDTHITHIYVSEHIITQKLKTRIRDLIRENRKKHKKHCDIKNLNVIIRCTHMWWNPINGVKELKPPPPTPPTPIKSQDKLKKEDDKKKKLQTKNLSKKDNKKNKNNLEDDNEDDDNNNINNNDQWLNESWKFLCVCGYQCSSYENIRYHPKGKMFECTECKIWSHIECVFGYKDDEFDKKNEKFIQQEILKIENELKIYEKELLEKKILKNWTNTYYNQVLNKKKEENQNKINTLLKKYKNYSQINNEEEPFFNFEEALMKLDEVFCARCRSNKLRMMRQWKKKQSEENLLEYNKKFNELKLKKNSLKYIEKNYQNEWNMMINEDNNNNIELKLINEKYNHHFFPISEEEITKEIEEIVINLNNEFDDSYIDNDQEFINLKQEYEKINSTDSNSLDTLLHPLLINRYERQIKYKSNYNIEEHKNENQEKKVDIKAEDKSDNNNTNNSEKNSSNESSSNDSSSNNSSSNKSSSNNKTIKNSSTPLESIDLDFCLLLSSLTDITDWKFLCKCKERCSSYELPLYHPKDMKFRCTRCNTYSHTKCMYGHSNIEEIKKNKDRLCFTCQGQVRRSRKAEELVELDMYVIKKKKPKKEIEKKVIDEEMNNNNINNNIEMEIDNKENIKPIEINENIIEDHIENNNNINIKNDINNESNINNNENIIINNDIQ